MTKRDASKAAVNSQAWNAAQEVYEELSLPFAELPPELVQSIVDHALRMALGKHQADDARYHAEVIFIDYPAWQILYSRGIITL